MVNTLLPCSRRDGVLPCERNRLIGLCLWCARPLAPGECEPPPAHVTPQQVAAVRRIRRGLHAEAARLLGVDPGLRRPPIDGLPALRASLSARHDVPMRVVEQILDDVVPMLDLLQRIADLVGGVAGVEFSEQGHHERAATLIDMIRDVLYLHVDDPRPASWAAGADIPDAPPTCDECGGTLAHVVGRGSSGARYEGIVCPHCDLGRSDDDTLEQRVHRAVARGDLDED